MLHSMWDHPGCAHPAGGRPHRAAGNRSTSGRRPLGGATDGSSALNSSASASGMIGLCAPRGGTRRLNCSAPATTGTSPRPALISVARSSGVTESSLTHGCTPCPGRNLWAALQLSGEQPGGGRAGATGIGADVSGPPLWRVLAFLTKGAAVRLTACRSWGRGENPERLATDWRRQEAIRRI
jgi:hypothetical protein